MANADAAAAAMQSVARAIRELSRVPARASRGASESIAALIQRQFDTGTDPYGRAWKPLKPSTIKKKGHARILIDKEKLRKGIDVRPMSGAGVQITIDADYAKYHQGTRPILPNRGLPATWKAAITGALTQETQRAIAGTGAVVSGSIIDVAAE